MDQPAQEILQQWLDHLAELADADMEMQNRVRDDVLSKSRNLIRLCSSAIRSGHRSEWEEARSLLAQADAIADDMQALLAPLPELYYAGYTQDALKELVEAHITLALISDSGLPDLENVDIPLNTYLNGVCEAASELRRRCLDMLRKEQFDEAERLLTVMDAVYEVLMSFSYPDAITRGLRRRVDQLRGVLERTRGDLTNSLQMVRLRKALKQNE
ncbi:MAG: haloacid dehalogenase [Anaerolineae bacterium]|nr:haloacid dehalogenase [Anaerolineae bacterium]